MATQSTAKPKADKSDHLETRFDRLHDDVQEMAKTVTKVATTTAEQGRQIESIAKSLAHVTRETVQSASIDSMQEVTNRIATIESKAGTLSGQTILVIVALLTAAAGLLTVSIDRSIQQTRVLHKDEQIQRLKEEHEKAETAAVERAISRERIKDLEERPRP